MGGDDDGWFLEPLPWILAGRRLWQERAAALRDASTEDAPRFFNAGFWHLSFVPFMSDRSATEVVVATAPCFGGPAGQIVSFDYSGGSWWRVASPSLEVFLATMAELMETNTSFCSRDEIQKARFPEYRVIELEESWLRDPSRFDGPPPPAPRANAGALIGRKGVVVRGTFQGFEGTVVDESSTALTITIQVFGRTVSAVVPYQDFDPRGAKARAARSVDPSPLSSSNPSNLDPFLHAATRPKFPVVRISCPMCSRVIEDAPDDYGPRPFCSTRCKLVDLDNWFNEAYRLSRPLTVDELDEVEQPENAPRRHR